MYNGSIVLGVMLQGKFEGMQTNFDLQLMVWCFYIQKCISSGNRSDKTILSLKCFHVMLVPSVQQNYNDVMFVEHENII